MITGNIIIIDDDLDDLDTYYEVLNSLKLDNKILLFDNPEHALEYLNSINEDIFFILSDINMPEINGFDLRKKLNKNAALRLKHIPFLFFSTSENTSRFKNSYTYLIQGYFKKPAHYEEIRQLLNTIIAYWTSNVRPIPVNLNNKRPI